MPSFVYEIEVEATPERIWDAWMDVERWPVWAPLFKSSRKLTEGNLDVGSRIRLHTEGIPKAIWEVTALRPREFFELVTEFVGVEVVAGHLISTETGRSTVRLTVDFRGFLAKPFRPVLLARARKNVTAEAEGLRSYCEEHN